MRQKVLDLFDAYSDHIGKNRLLLVFSALHLFDFLDHLRLKGFPKDWFFLLEDELGKAQKISKLFRQMFDASLTVQYDENLFENEKDINARTGEVYFNL